MHIKLILNIIHKILYKVLFKGNVKHIIPYISFAPHLFHTILFFINIHIDITKLFILTAVHFHSLTDEAMSWAKRSFSLTRL